MDLGGPCERLSVTAFNAGRGRPEFGVQFTLGGSYCALDGAQAAHLVDLLQKRLAVAPGYASTDEHRSEAVPVGVDVGPDYHPDLDSAARRDAQ